ncbi:MAG TPA: aminoglycoside phosphotransferase family protein, partial [Pyrinomonadaceae bacterium]
FANPATIKRRLEMLTTSLQLDYTRTLKWSYAQAVLSAIWEIEDGHQANAGLLLARQLQASKLKLEL